MLTKVLLIVSVVTFLVSVVWYLFVHSGRFKGVSWKYGCSSLFIIIALIASTFSQRTDCFCTLMIGGFVLSAFGDMFLDLSMGGKNFILGVISFAVGHCFFIAGYSTVLKNDSGIKLVTGLQLALLAAYIIASLGIYILKKYKPDFIHVFVYFYGAVLATMVIKAQFVGFYGGKAVLLTSTAGAVLFFVSDFVLLGMIFDGKDDVKHTRLNLATYYGGQLLMALGLAFV